MKFAHIADTHLGYRQFGLNEREHDFYEVFDKIIDKIIEEKVDFVIHSGDLFETARPTPQSLLVFQKALLRLKGAGITMYVIAGNHDTALRSGSIPPQVIFKKLGLKVISTINTEYVQGDIHIMGLPFFPKSQIKDFKNKLQNISKKAEKYDKSILVLHQGIDKYLPFQYELEIGDIPDNFNYYAFGHIHNYVNEEFGKGYLVYPGSTEIWKTNELMDATKNGKGFVIVDMDGEKPDIKRVTIDSPRKFINKTVDIKDLTKVLAEIKKDIKDLDKEPIVNLNINNLEGDAGEIHDLINEELDDDCLLVRPRFNYEEDFGIIEPGIDSGIEITELIKENLEKYEDEAITNLAIDIYENLSKGKEEAAQEIIKQFYEDYYTVVEETEEEPEEIELPEELAAEEIELEGTVSLDDFANKSEDKEEI